jgi:exonuclease SbcD
LKIIHIADMHLGAAPHAENPWGINRERELWQALEKIVQIAEEEKADLLLIAGDLFHRQPLVRELKELNYIFSKLTHTKVVFIAGNHDYIKANSYYNTFEWAEHVYCLKSQACESFYFKELNTEVYGLSYHNYEIRDNLYDSITIQDKTHINILLAHGGDEKHIPFSKTELGLKGFDYIALGHIHMPQILIPDRMAYAGAPEPIDSGDTGAHGFLRVDLNKDHSKIQFVKSAKREYITIEILVDSSYTNAMLIHTIQEKLGKLGNQDGFIKIVIRGYRDEDITFDIQEIYKLGMIVSVVDLAEPDYDFDKFMKDYSRNIIGKFIQNMKKEHMTEVEKKALYYGVKSMLDEMG